MSRILVVEDDPDIADLLQHYLSQAGHDLTVLSSGTEAVARVQADAPDLVVLDIMLPGKDGWQVCHEVRQFSQVPIIMLTALGQEIDRIRGLELGADDYLTKPFSFHALVAHIKSLLRRVQWDQALLTASQVRIGEVVLDPGAHRAWKASQELALRNKEYELLSLLMQQAGKVLTRELLFNQIWGTDWLGDTRTLDVHIRWLRQKIENDPSAPQYIQTVRNVGYRFATPEEVRL